MADIKLSQLPEVSSLVNTDILPAVASGTTSKITLENLANTLPQVSSSISASYALTASYALNSTPGVAGFPKHWIYNQTKSLQDDETLVISDNFVLKNSLLMLTASAESFTVGPVVFTKQSQIFIGGNMLLVDSNIVNDGYISVAGAVILSGSSTITGTGTLI